jgi:hypothetical protein
LPRFQPGKKLSLLPQCDRAGQRNFTASRRAIGAPLAAPIARWPGAHRSTRAATRAGRRPQSRSRRRESGSQGSSSFSPEQGQRGCPDAARLARIVVQETERDPASDDDVLGIRAAQRGYDRKSAARRTPPSIPALAPRRSSVAHDEPDRAARRRSSNHGREPRKRSDASSAFFRKEPFWLVTESERAGSPNPPSVAKSRGAARPCRRRILPQAREHRTNTPALHF